MCTPLCVVIHLPTIGDVFYEVVIILSWSLGNYKVQFISKVGHFALHFSNITMLDTSHVIVDE